VSDCNAVKVRICARLLLKWLGYDDDANIMGIYYHRDVPQDEFKGVYSGNFGDMEISSEGVLDIFIRHPDMPGVNEGGTVLDVTERFIKEKLE
jgi:hypothetical protein